MRLEVQRRTLPTGFEMRGDAGSGATLIGHAAVFDTETIIMGMFREKISPGAFKKTIKEADVRALFNHEPNFVLGRNKAGTLKLREDDQGLAYEITLPDTQVAKDLYTSIERGDISQSSFAFKIVQEVRTEPDEDAGETLPLFDVKETKLYDVSPVTFPAYDETDVSANSAYDPLGYATAIARFAEWCEKSTAEVRECIEQAKDDSERSAKLRSLWIPRGITPETEEEVTEAPEERSETAEETQDESEAREGDEPEVTPEAESVPETPQEIILHVDPELLGDAEALTNSLMGQLREQFPDLFPEDSVETPDVDESADRSEDAEVTDEAVIEPPEAPENGERSETLDETSDTTDEPDAESAPLASRARLRNTLSTF